MDHTQLLHRAPLRLLRAPSEKLLCTARPACDAQVRVHFDHGEEHVIEVYADSCAGLHEFLICAAHFGDISCDAGETDDFSRRIADGVFAGEIDADLAI